MMNSIRFGFADRIITPSHPACVYLDGYGFRMHPAEAVRDDLHAKVCAMVEGEKIFLLFSLDLIGLRPRTYELITAQITALTGIPKENMALTCIHTHAAPAAGLLDELPVNYDYLAYVGEICGRAAKSAIERACPGTFRFEVLPETLLHAYNRRKREPIDRSIRAAAFRDETGALRGVLCSASCHAVVNTQYTVSADWLAELNTISSDELPYLYLQGRCGDIDPYFEDKLPIDDKIRILGKELSEPVARMANTMHTDSPLTGALQWKYETVCIPMMAQTDTETLKKDIRAHEEAYFANPPANIKKHYNLRRLQWLRHMLRMAEAGESFDTAVPLQVLAIGKACVFAFVPFELLTLTGNKLEDIFVRAGYARERIYICGYSNIVEGYLPPAEEFAYGGYEVINAAAWYNISRACPETEATMLAWFEKQAQMLEKT